MSEGKRVIYAREAVITVHEGEGDVTVEVRHGDFFTTLSLPMPVLRTFTVQGVVHLHSDYSDYGEILDPVEASVTANDKDGHFWSAVENDLRISLEEAKRYVTASSFEKVSTRIEYLYSAKLGRPVPSELHSVVRISLTCRYYKELTLAQALQEFLYDEGGFGGWFKIEDKDKQ